MILSPGSFWTLGEPLLIAGIVPVFPLLGVLCGGTSWNRGCSSEICHNLSGLALRREAFHALASAQEPAHLTPFSALRMGAPPVLECLL